MPAFLCEDQEPDTHILSVVVGKKKGGVKCKQLWRTRIIGTCTDPAWMKITSKRCHCVLRAKLTHQISEGCSPTGLTVWIIVQVMSYHGIEARAEARELSSQAPIQVLVWSVSTKIWGGGHLLQRLRCRINVLGVGPAMEAEAWREAQGPSDWNWCHIWNMESIKHGSFCHLKRENVAQRWGHIVGMLQSSWRSNFLNCECRELLSAYLCPFPISFALQPISNQAVSRRPQRFFFCCFTNILSFLPKFSFAPTSPSFAFWCVDIQLRCGHSDLAEESGSVLCVPEGSWFLFIITLVMLCDTCLSGYLPAASCATFR